MFCKFKWKNRRCTSSVGFGTFCWHNFEHNSVFFSGSIIKHNSLSHEHNKSLLALLRMSTQNSEG